MKRVIVACGSGVATSQAVASKVQRILKQRGVEADVEAVDIKSLDHYINGADAYISIGIAFLTGMGADAEADRLVELLES